MPRLARLRFLSAPLILLLISMAFCWKLVLTNEYTWLEGPDLAFQVLPWYQFQAAEWHDGRFPLWDPNHWGGQPLLGQAQPGAAYPLNWLLFSLPLRHGWIQQAALHWYFLLIHFLGSLFTYLLCRDLGRRRSASILAGCVFAYGGFVGTNDWPQMLNGAIWAPLIFLFLLRAVRGDRPVASACLSGACLGLSWLSGHHQIPLFVTLAATATWAYYSIRDRRVIRLVALFGLFLFLTSALQTLPAYEYGKLSHRWVGLEDPIPWDTKVPYSIHSKFSTAPETLLGILFPGMYFHTNPFMGILAISLALLAIASWFESSMVRLFAAIAIGGLFFTLGDRTLFQGVIYAIVPVFDKARSPSMAVFIFNFGISILTAYGIDSLRDKKAPLWGRRIAIGLVGIWALVFGIVLGCALVGKPLTENRPLLTALFAVLGAGLIYGYLRGNLAGRTLGLLTALLVAGELSLTFGFLFPSRYEPDRNPYLKQIPEAAEVIRYLRTQRSMKRIDVDDKILPFNAGDFYGFEQMGGYLASLSSNMIRMEAHTERTQQLFAVNYFIGKAARFPSQKVVFEDAKGLKVFSNPAAFPRAWTIHELRRLPGVDEIRRFIGDPNIDLRSVASMVGEPPELEKCQGDEEADVRVHRSDFVQINTRLQCRGMVILADTFFPGWKATMDGKPVRIYEPYGILRGVVAEKGAHVIQYRYRPISVQLGAGLTLLGFAGAIFFLTRRVNHS
jgi:hypothetical protein